MVLLYSVEALTGFTLLHSFDGLTFGDLLLDLGYFALAWGVAILILKLYDALRHQQRASLEK